MKGYKYMCFDTADYKRKAQAELAEVERVKLENEKILKAIEDAKEDKKKDDQAESEATPAEQEPVARALENI